MAETWIDTRSGDLLIGAEAANERIDEAGPDIVPLVDLLESEEFPFENGDFGSIEVRGWSPDELVNFGHWVLGVLSREDDINTKMLSRKHIDRLHTFGLCPSFRTFQNKFTTLWQYREALSEGPERGVGKFKDWTFADYVTHASKLAQSLGRKPRQEDYFAADGPSHKQIQRYTGESVSMLNEFIGYPHVPSMDEDDYLDWGVKVMEANGGRLSASIIGILAARERGPGVKAVVTKFVSVPRFREQVQERFEVLRQESLAARQEKLEEYQRLQSEWELPEEVAALPDDEVASFIAKYWVAMKCLPDVRTENHIDIAASSWGLIRRIRSSFPYVSPADIEIMALKLQVFDDIWPLNDYKEFLYVTDEELESVRKFERERKRARKAKAKNNNNSNV